MASVRRLDRGRWKITIGYPGPDGKRKQESETFHGSERAAKDRGAEWEKERRAEASKRRPRSGEPTFSEMVERWIDDRRDDWTAQHLRAQLGHLADISDSPLGDVPMSQLTNRDLVEHLKEYRRRPIRAGGRRLGSSSRKRALVLRSVTKAAIADADVIVHGDPAHGITVKHVSRTVADRKLPDWDVMWLAVERGTRAQEDELNRRAAQREAAGWGPPPFRDRPALMRDICHFALLTGLRRGELLALRRSDVAMIDERSGVLHISHCVREDEHDREAWVDSQGTKTKRSRKVDIGPNAIAIVERRLGVSEMRARVEGVAPLDDPYLFSEGWGEAFIIPKWVSKWWGQLRDVVAPTLDGVRFHDLRHAHATTLHRMNEPVKDIADRLGHSPVESLSTYNHARESGGAVLRDIVESQLDAITEGNI